MQRGPALATPAMVTVGNDTLMSATPSPLMSTVYGDAFTCVVTLSVAVANVELLSTRSIASLAAATLSLRHCMLLIDCTLDIEERSALAVIAAKISRKTIAMTSVAPRCGWRELGWFF